MRCCISRFHSVRRWRPLRRCIVYSTCGEFYCKKENFRHIHHDVVEVFFTASSRYFILAIQENEALICCSKDSRRAVVLQFIFLHTQLCSRRISEFELLPIRCKKATKMYGLYELRAQKSVCMCVCTISVFYFIYSKNKRSDAH